MSSSRRIARVVLDSRLPQLNRLFDYAIPEGMDISPGVRVRVPLRSSQRLAEGYVVECPSDTDHPGKLTEVATVVSPVPVLPPQLWQLAHSVASRTAGGAADVLRLAIPKRYVKVEKSWWGEGRDLERPPLSSSPGIQLDTSLVNHELLTPGARVSLSLPYGVSSSATGAAIPRSAKHLADIAVQGLDSGMSVALICPDWRDVEHMKAALEDRVPAHNLAVLAGDGEPAARYRDYLRTLEPTPVIVLGSRHAVYAPAFNLGLIVIIDDADSAHREPLAPYPHSRDIALVRNAQENSAVCFASVTPSLAVRRWIDMGYVQEGAPPAMTRPRVIPTSLTMGAEALSAPARLPSSVYRAAQKALSTGPVLVQVFRAGFSPGLSCAHCSSKAACGHCGGPLRQTAAGSTPRCLWCDLASPRWVCSECGGSELRPRGQAIGRTVSELGKSFPAVPVIRSDGEHRVAQVANTPALVVSTRGAEPITPGGYAMVLLLDGAAMLQRDSLSALEESIHAWEHAISLAADDAVCYVTDLEGPPALALGAGSWTPVLRHELSQRTALKLPPAVRLASLAGPAADVERVRTALTEISPQIDALGPVALDDGGVLTVVRFPYSHGESVVTELAAWRAKLASGPSRRAVERLKIVVDDARALDTLAGE